MPDNFEFDDRCATSDAPLDEYLSFSREDHRAIKEGVMPEILAFELRKRRRRQHDETAFGFIVCLVIANALKATVYSPTGKVQYSRQRAAYSNEGKTLYFPGFLGSKSLCNAIDLMASGGWLVTELGTRKSDGQRGRRSTFHATEKLVLACTALGISHHKARRDGAPALILKDESKRRIPYDRGEHRQTTESVWAYNRFISEQPLMIEVPADEWTKWAEQHEGKRNRQNHKSLNLDLRATALYRVFNNSDWKQGGRFFGGWWQSIPSPWREHIKINGEKTIELDYSGFFARAIYHGEGYEYRDDPYEVPAIRALADKRGMDWETVRTSIKLATNILINAKPDVGLRLMKGLKFPKGLTKTKAFDLIAAHHARIAHKFRSGEGLRIMNTESSICQDILTEGRLAGIAVLPVHDSFLVQASRRQWLWDQMVSSYRSYFGFSPEIKEKLGKIDEIEAGSSAIPLQGLPIEQSPLEGTVSRKGELTSRLSNISHSAPLPYSAAKLPPRDSTNATQADLRFQAILDSFRNVTTQ